MINEEQAKIVKRIYNEYLDGKNTSQIARDLSNDGIKTVTGKDRWHPTTIISILKNEKYIGDCLMQKFYVEDFLTKKMVRNQGELQQYYVKGHHEPIISEEVYNAVQRKMKAIQKKKHQSGARDFSSMVICGDCGSYYGSKVWHSNDKYKKIVYRCNKKYNGDKCNTPAVDEDRLREVFIEAINKLLENKGEIVSNMERALAIKNETNYEEIIRRAVVELDKAEAAFRALIDRQKVTPIAFEEYEKKIRTAGKRYDKAKEEYDRLLEESQNRTRSIYEIEQFIKSLVEQNEVIVNYDYGLMKRTVKQITISNNSGAIFEFYDGSEIAVDKVR